MTEQTVQRRLQQAQMPARLRDLVPAPDSVWVAGRVSRLPPVGVVGTRKPTPEAENFAFQLARDLALAGVAVISGGALGIDSAAHRGALAGNGETLVVAPAGLQAPYPDGNASLFLDILRAGGGYLSLVEPTQKARLASFFARNSALAALCEVLVIVQAPLRSGARNASAAARRMGRVVAAVPGAPWEPVARGCIAELRLGATPIEGWRQVYELLAQRGGVGLPNLSRSNRGTTTRGGSDRGRGQRSSGDQLGTAACSGGAGEPTKQGELFEREEFCVQRRRVVDAIRSGCDSVDGICEGTGLSVAEVQGVLLRLELSGELTRLSAQTFSLL